MLIDLIHAQTKHQPNGLAVMQSGQGSELWKNLPKK